MKVEIQLALGMQIVCNDVDIVNQVGAAFIVVIC